MMKTLSIVRAVFWSSIALCACNPLNLAGGDKPWVIVESHLNFADDANLGDRSRVRRNKRLSKKEQTEADFRRILIDRIAGSGRFRCSERDTIQSMLRENAMGAEADVSFTSADRGIKWTLRESTERYLSADGGRNRKVKGLVLTITLSFVNLTADGNGEVLDSDTVVVRERFANGADLYTYAARNAARAILFKLAAPRIIDVSRDVGGVFATVDYGSDFFAKGERVVIMERALKNGIMMSSPRGRGVVAFADKGATRISVESGSAAEGWHVAMADDDMSAPLPGAAAIAPGSQMPTSVQAPAAAVRCSQCRGTGRVVTKTPCQQCNGRGRIANPAAQVGDVLNTVSAVAGNRRRVSRAPSEINCPSCNRRGFISGHSQCPGCNGTGSVSR